ncbi:MAG: DODA-type extradiol aromatic ring-opening family dioxygenase [Hyphomicrobiaceae bacterium]
MARPPVLFISHGSPELAVRETATHTFLKGYGSSLGKPRAILVISAHWETADVQVGGSAHPETIYDFRGFDPLLREIVYGAPAALDVADMARSSLEAAGSAVTRDPSNGYDHGVWVPLHLLFPEADVPVAQVSIQPKADPAHHHRLGEALAPLRDTDVMIVASGAMTHNLGAFTGQVIDADVPAWVSGFNEWFADRLAARDVETLLDYRTLAPFAVENHPTDEHLLPVFAALGAGDGQPGKRVHAGYEHGVLSMDVYRFE